MHLQQAVNNVFVQLAGSLNQLSAEDYVRPCAQLSNSTIGQHVRHIIEMFQCLETGYASGVVNYEKRKRDNLIETNKDIALSLLQEIYTGLGKDNTNLLLEGVYNDDSTDLLQLPTNYHREIIYNLEHTIHHMALIRVGIKEIAAIDLPESYGVASATVKHKQSCAQ
ncbi:MAG: hypothetical protein SFU87_19165 [Chitinophagaceae bacterium]|nr:hypothetical protein [Chitinophagaceae bacterium]